MSLICQGKTNINHNISIFNKINDNVLSFPQMKLEKKAVALTEEEKLVLQIIKENHPTLLADVKVQSELSGKKWDAAIKGLTGKKLAQVFKDGENLMVKPEE